MKSARDASYCPSVRGGSRVWEGRRAGSRVWEGGAGPGAEREGGAGPGCGREGGGSRMWEGGRGGVGSGCGREGGAAAARGQLWEKGKYDAKVRWAGWE